MHSVWPDPLACRWSIASSMLSTSSSVTSASPYSCLHESQQRASWTRCCRNHLANDCLQTWQMVTDSCHGTGCVLYKHACMPKFVTAPKATLAKRPCLLNTLSRLLSTLELQVAMTRKCKVQRWSHLSDFALSMLRACEARSPPYIVTPAFRKADCNLYNCRYRHTSTMLLMLSVPCRSTHSQCFHLPT